MLAMAYTSISGLEAQSVNVMITIDQFGYQPDAEKIAVLRNPITGFDADEEYCPADSLLVIDARSDKAVYAAPVLSWKQGSTDPSSGDQVWHFDFSPLNMKGSYYILDPVNNIRSFNFEIAENIYAEVLRQAVRTFYYQRAGYPKLEASAGKGWSDAASHLGPGQDTECRSFFAQNDKTGERDVSGGWYDAGDYNKYTNWTASYIIEMLTSYLEAPEVWADDYGLPWSGNGKPDLLDECDWGLEHLMRLQDDNGPLLSIVGLSHASPPSAAAGPSYYGPVSTSATLSGSAAFALASYVAGIRGDTLLAALLLEKALGAWNWADENPEILFNNNDPRYNSVGLGAGRQEVSSYKRGMLKLEAACYLFAATSGEKFRNYFHEHFRENNLFTKNMISPFEADDLDILLFYTSLPGSDPEISSVILNQYASCMLGNADQYKAISGMKDPYMAYIRDYTWGSNATKSSQGNLYFNLISYYPDSANKQRYADIARQYIHYIHGVNPLGMVYLSNMYRFGAENCVNEFYHSWFANGSALWDRVGTSIYGPPPGYLTGGPNPHYNWDRCCPDNCRNKENNEACLSESISPPTGQPPQKSYKDFNTSWPLNSWEITENSCGYQVKYIRLLSKFAGQTALR